MLIQLEDSGNVSAAVAVVWRAPHRDQLVVEHPLVAVHHQLVCAADEVDLVGLVELRHDLAAEQVAGAARRQAPALDVLQPVVAGRRT
eukprot:189382-Chlamydomonas_euryale.AAC.5